MSRPTDPTNQPSSTPLPSIHLAILALRLLLLSFLILSQTPLLYKASFVAYSALHPSASERASLLNNGTAISYGSNGVDGCLPKKKGTIRSSRPPNSRPPDPKSLSLLTLFTRIKTLFPYLWPSKSFSLQVLAIICVARESLQCRRPPDLLTSHVPVVMLLKRFVNVGVPFLFGRIVGDLSAGRRESLLSVSNVRAVLTPRRQLHTSTLDSTYSRPSSRTPIRCCIVSSAIYPRWSPSLIHKPRRIPLAQYLAIL